MLTRLTRQYTHKKRSYYTFECTCGSITIKRGDSPAEYCGTCILSPAIRHGESHTRLYTIWSGMRDRCLGTHKSSKTYKNKGISISPLWDLFTDFKVWAEANGYMEDLTIDRIDINGDYSPSNCEWVTRSENTKRQIRDGHSVGIRINIHDHISNSLIGSFHSAAETARYIITNYAPDKNSKAIDHQIRKMRRGLITNYLGLVFIEEAK